MRIRCLTVFGERSGTEKFVGRVLGLDYGCFFGAAACHTTVCDKALCPETCPFNGLCTRPVFRHGAAGLQSTRWRVQGAKCGYMVQDVGCVVRSAGYRV